MPRGGRRTSNGAPSSSRVPAGHFRDEHGFVIPIGNGATPSAPAPRITERYPDRDEHGRTIQYYVQNGDLPTHRGVLLSSQRGDPAASWQELIHTFDGSEPVLNLVSYVVEKKLNERQKAKAKDDLHTLFALAFPNKRQPVIDIEEGNAGVTKDSEGKPATYVYIDTPFDNVPADNIIAKAHIQGWKIAGVGLGAPWYVGFQTTELLQQIKFLEVPEEIRDDFLACMPTFLEEDLDDINTIEVLDVWEKQVKEGNGWKREGGIMVLVSILPATEGATVAGIASSWPGFYRLGNHLIKVELQGRFNFCEECGDFAQGLQNRHEGHEEGEERDWLAQIATEFPASSASTTAGPSSTRSAATPGPSRNRPTPSIKVERSPSPPPPPPPPPQASCSRTTKPRKKIKLESDDEYEERDELEPTPQPRRSARKRKSSVQVKVEESIEVKDEESP